MDLLREEGVSDLVTAKGYLKTFSVGLSTSSKMSVTASRECRSSVTLYMLIITYLFHPHLEQFT